MAQPLTIRFATDVEGAKKGVADLAGSIAGNMTKIVGALRSGGGQIDSSLAGAVARISALQLAMASGALVAGVLFAKAISDASEQLDRYVKIGEQASKVGLDVESFQRFVQALGGGKDAIEALEKGLDGVKLKFEEVGKVRTFLGELFSTGFTGDFVSQGLRQFDQAADDKGRLQAAVTAMRELQDLGLNLAAVKLGDLLFGPEVAERIRQGKLDIADLAATIEGTKSSEIISEEDIRRAEALHERIEKAKTEIANGVQASINLANAGQPILNIWADILGMVAKAIGAMNSFVAGAQKAAQVAQTSTIEQKISALELGLQRDSGLSPLQRKGREEQLTALRAERAALLPDVKLAPVVDNDLRSTAPGAGPARKPTDFAEMVAKLDKNKPRGGGGGGGGSEGLDRIESFINALERSRDVLQAELDNLGKSNVEREKAIELAKAEAAARAAQRDLTDAERASIIALAEAQGRLKDKIMDVKQAQQQAAEAARFMGGEISDVLGAIFVDGRKADDVLKDLGKSLLKMALQAALTGQGSLASILGFAPKASDGQNAVGGIFGLLLGLGKGYNFNGTSGGDYSYGAGGYYGQGPFRAGGGDVKAGRAYTVGELGREIFIPDRDGKVYPVGRGQAGGGGGANYAPVYNIDARGADPAAVARIEQGLAARDRQFGRNVQSVVRNTQMRGTRA